jgi:DNA-directed RNA polymerase specialized sigma24 family protein
VTDVDESITAAYRDEWGTVVAALMRRFGDLDLAEEAAAEAFAIAVERWPTTGTPPNPGGWLTVTAVRKAIDRLRREPQTPDKHHQATMLDRRPNPHTGGVIDDDRLRLMFTCCHPALAIEARVALTLRMLGGLTVARSPEPSSCHRPRSRSGSRGPRRRSRRPISRSAHRPAPTRRPPDRRAHRAVPRVQRGLPRDGAPTPNPSVTTSPPTRSVSPAW